MFGMSLMKQTLQNAWLRSASAMAGIAFTLMAMAAIQYDEVIAPRVGSLSDGWSDVATVLGRRLTSFSL